ncbi:MAG TPA: arginase family protein [Candidatus Micrarchaeia archaeon]|nr:arginase family protein [Candidatus Micrarchaeia archaeon]
MLTPVQIVVVGVPNNSSGVRGGVAAAPAVLRRSGLLSTLAPVASVVDHGDVLVPEPTLVRDDATRIIDPQGMTQMIRGVTEAVRAIVSAAAFPLVVGGDCPLILGCLEALDRAVGPAGLLFIDGHEDAYPPDRSPTGEAADMEMALALGMAPAPWSRGRGPELPLLQPRDVVMLGPRDQDALAREGVRSVADRVRLVSDAACNRDPGGSMAAALADLRHCRAGVWLHMDMDVLTTQAMSAVDYPQEGGLEWSTLRELVTTALSDPLVVGWDVTVYNPDIDPGHAHAAAILEVLRAGAEAVSGRSAEIAGPAAQARAAAPRR